MADIFLKLQLFIFLVTRIRTRSILYHFSLGPWQAIVDNNVIMFCNPLQDDVWTQIYTDDVSEVSLNTIRSNSNPKLEGTEIDNCVTKIWRTNIKCAGHALPFEACHIATKYRLYYLSSWALSGFCGSIVIGYQSLKG